MPAAVTEREIFVCLKGGRSAENERIHERTAGHEGSSQSTALFVPTGEAGRDQQAESPLHNACDVLLQQRSGVFFNWQRNAKALAEQMYRSKLQKAGLEEKFVEETGESFRSEDDTDTNDSSTEDEKQSR